MGYASLFAFLTEYIGYTPASAQRRIEAARLLTAVPEVKADVQSGSLNLSQVSLVAQAIRQKQKENPNIEFKVEDKRELLNSVKGKSLEASQAIVSQTLDLEIKQTEKKRIQGDESVRLELTLNKKQNEMLNKVKALISYANPNPTTAEIFELMALDYLKRKSPDREVRNYKTTSATEVTAHQTLIAKRNPIPANVKRYVWKRDHSCCQFKNPATGKMCGSKHFIEIDHIKRVRHGGDNDPRNLQLLCHAHNHWRG
jgi:hypothetical protein